MSSRLFQNVREKRGLAYAVFSGWGVPSQRTIWMLACMALLRLVARAWPWPWVWLLACATVVTLDPQRAGGPHVRADIYADDVVPEDLLGMTDTLNLTANAADTARLVERRYKTRWLTTLLRCDDFAALAEETTANQSSLEALARRLSRFDSDRAPFFHLDKEAGTRDGLVDTVVGALLQRRSVVSKNITTAPTTRSPSNFGALPISAGKPPPSERHSHSPSVRQATPSRNVRIVGHSPRS